MDTQQDERRGLPSASAWRRYELCAGSFQLEQEAKQLGQLAHECSPAAERGELIHAWLAGLPDEDGNEIRLDESEQQTADFLQERAQEQAQRIFGDEKPSMLAEKRLWFEIGGKKVASGKFDRVIYTSTLALVQDFKTGWSEPDPAEQNSQMKMLAVLVALHMPKTLCELVVQVISGPFGVTEARYDRLALAKAWDDIQATLRAIGDPFAGLSPSPAACRYCAAINVCPAVKNLVPSMREVEVLPDGARGAELLDSVEVLQKRLDSIREYYAARLTEDPAYDLPGYAMVPGSTRREVNDWETARSRLGEYLEAADIKGAANYRLGDLEKALGKVLKLKGKPLKDKMAAILHGLIVEKENAASLKRVNGKAKVLIGS